MKNLSLLIILSSFFSCSNSTLQNELKKVKDELAITKTTIETLKSQIDPEGKLVHVVFFKLKPDADLETMIAEVKKLEAIDEVKDLEVGYFENLGDDRALSEYSMMMEMSFDNVAAYEKYQKHPIHLALKENAKPLMAGPPATYDFMKR